MYSEDYTLHNGVNEFVPMLFAFFSVFGQNPKYEMSIQYCVVTVSFVDSLDERGDDYIVLFRS
jgi:hypothetical protein